MERFELSRREGGMDGERFELSRLGLKLPCN